MKAVAIPFGALRLQAHLDRVFGTEVLCLGEEFFKFFDLGAGRSSGTTVT